MKKYSHFEFLKLLYDQILFFWPNSFPAVSLLKHRLPPSFVTSLSLLYKLSHLGSFAYYFIYTHQFSSICSITHSGVTCYRATCILSNKYTPIGSHIHSPSPFHLWPNLSDLNHLRAFSNVCPSWTLVHLTAPREHFSWLWLIVSSPAGTDGLRGLGREGWRLYSQTTTAWKAPDSEQKTWGPLWYMYTQTLHLQPRT